MREVSLETLPNVNIRDPRHDKNLPIISVTGSINQNLSSSLSNKLKAKNTQLLFWRVKYVLIKKVNHKKKNIKMCRR